MNSSNSLKRIKGEVTGAWDNGNGWRISVEGTYVSSFAKSKCPFSVGEHVDIMCREVVKKGKTFYNFVRTYDEDMPSEKAEPEQEKVVNFKDAIDKHIDVRDHRMYRSVAWKCAVQVGRHWEVPSIQAFKQIAREIEKDIMEADGNEN